MAKPMKYEITSDIRNVVLAPSPEKSSNAKLMLNNPGDNRVAVKIKTNQTQMRIQPALLFIEKKSDKRVYIQLKPWKDYNPSKTYADHRIVIQYANADDYKGLAKAFWNPVPKNYRDLKLTMAYDANAMPLSASAAEVAPATEVGASGFEEQTEPAEETEQPAPATDAEEL